MADELKNKKILGQEKPGVNENWQTIRKCAKNEGKKTRLISPQKERDEKEGEREFGEKWNLDS